MRRVALVMAIPTRASAPSCAALGDGLKAPRIIDDVRTSPPFGLSGPASGTSRLAGLKGWIGGGSAPCAFSGALSPTSDAIAIRDMAKGRSMLWALWPVPCGAGRGEPCWMIGVRSHAGRMADKNSACAVVSVALDRRIAFRPFYMPWCGG